MSPPHEHEQRRTIAVVTGTRAEFGLLRPVMRAVRDHPSLRLRVIAAGCHLLGPARTIREVESEFEVAATVPMQIEGRTGRSEDAAALGRGILGFGESFAREQPDVVLVLGDRIEAFAAACAAAVGGIRVAHVHGGDRAAGIADEAMRHAITKLAHIHFAATALSAERLLYLGELPLHVHLVGSPAIDDLASIPPLPDDEHERMGRPEIVFLLHPEDIPADEEFMKAERLLAMCVKQGRTIALHPNCDPGREHVMAAIEQVHESTRQVNKSASQEVDKSTDEAHHRLTVLPHLPREKFIGLLRRAKVIVGNSSAGLIECSALNLPCVNVGVRQLGREAPRNVMSIAGWDFGDISLAIERSLAQQPQPIRQPYGDGRAGEKIAEVLASLQTRHYPLSKRNAY